MTKLEYDNIFESITDDKETARRLQGVSRAMIRLSDDLIESGVSKDYHDKAILAVKNAAFK